MKKHTARTMAAVILGGLTMMGCESQDRYAHTRFTPISDTEFVYDALVIAGYSDADRERWLRDEIAKYGMCPNGFEVVDKRFVEVSGFLDASKREVTRGRCLTEG